MTSIPLEAELNTLINDLKDMEDKLYFHWQALHELRATAYRDNIMDLLHAVTYVRGVAEIYPKRAPVDVRGPVTYMKEHFCTICVDRDGQGGATD